MNRSGEPSRDRRDGAIVGTIGHCRKAARDMEALRAQWGTRFENRMTSAQRALYRFGGEHQAALTEAIGHASALDFLAQVGDALGEDAPPIGEGHPPVEVPAALTMIPFVGDLLIQVQKWLPVVFQVVGAFSMIAAMSANDTDDKVVNYILKAINFLGFNFGTAKNDPTVGVTAKTGE